MEHILTEISFKEEFCKGSLYFTKMAIPTYVSHSMYCSYCVSDIHPLRCRCMFSLLESGGGYDHLINGVRWKQSCVTSRLGYNKDTVSVWLCQDACPWISATILGGSPSHVEKPCVGFLKLSS